ncbi:peptidase M16C associated-domain-containing protein [Scheffersomyces amazonensis]|uniref:peptidase M16C associated-domain-containing protein n=1 Tax=Scheffersomyces amazonensis TaxID=1078765 RepID=UPI00315C96F5
MLRSRLVPLSRRLGRRFNSSVTNSDYSTIVSKYPIGSNIHGYTVKRVQQLPEYSAVAVLLNHDKTKSEHLHLETPSDNNNVFSIAFKTNPPDSTGVPHILEHTTLCGSKKYPVRDPFFKMANRSLSSFMNAMTGHDFTYYPFATTNVKDYYNLMDVYLSSVLEPLLTEEDFLQEGWRLENYDINDPESEFGINGVVYNEMKGQYSNTSYIFYTKFLQAIYPSLNNAAGDPAKITNLKHEDLVNFHKENYHPSNSKTFTYGSFPLEGHLKKLDEYFSKFDPRPLDKTIQKPIFDSSTTPYLQRKYSVNVIGPHDSQSVKPIVNQYKSSLTYYLGSCLDEKKLYEYFKWKVLSSFLLDGHFSPFYSELIEYRRTHTTAERMAEDFSPNIGVDMTTSLLSFTIGFTGLKKATVVDLPTTVKGVLIEKVMPYLALPESDCKDRVRAIIHQIELGLKKHKPDFGLGLLDSIVPSWINGLDPIKSLNIEPILERFKKELETKHLKVFEDMLKILLNSNSRVFQFTMIPVESYYDDLRLEEQVNLQNKVLELNKDELKQLQDRNIKLAEKRQEQEDNEVLPTLTMEDIPKIGSFHPVEYSDLKEKTTIQKRIVDTNGLVYVTAAADIGYIDPLHINFLPFYLNSLTGLNGTIRRSIGRLENKIQQNTGGVSFSLRVVQDPYDITNARLQLVLSGMALKSKSYHIYELWYEIIKESRLGELTTDLVRKVEQIIINMNVGQYDMISDRGHSFAAMSSASRLLPSGFLNELVSGVSQARFLQDLNNRQDLKGSKRNVKLKVIPVLYAMSKSIPDLSKTTFKYRIVGDKNAVMENEAYIAKFDYHMTQGETMYKDEYFDYIQRRDKLAETMRKNDELMNSTRYIKPINEPSMTDHIEFESPPMDNIDHIVNSFNKGKYGKNLTEKRLINLPFPVSHTSLSKLGAPYASKDGAVLQVLSQLYTFKHLHSVIREANGAYGGGLTYDGVGGLLNFYSYRDPDPFKSIDAFQNSFEYGLLSNWTEKDLQEAKLRIFQSIDAPSSIASQGSSEFFEGITDDMRQERRENFLNVTNADLQDAIQKYLIDNKSNSITVIGDNDILDVGDDWTITDFRDRKLRSFQWNKRDLLNSQQQQ